VLWLALALVVLCVLIGVPVALAIVLGTLAYYITSGYLPTELVFQAFVSGTQSFPLLAIPFFVLMGELMNAAGMTSRLVRLAEGLVGHLTGGLAQVNVVTNALLGGPSGSGNADAAAISKILVPEMERRGYDRGWSAALTAAGSIMGPIIPPGIGLILFGFLANISIGKLFIGGIVPGLMIGLFLMVVAYVMSKKRGYQPSRERMARPRELASLSLDAFWALMLPVLIVVGIRFGVFTPTEAAAIGVVYALIVGFFVYRNLRLRDLAPVLASTVKITAVIMLLVAAASTFGRMLTLEQVPNQIATLMASVSSNPYVFLAVINVVLLVVGCFVESTALLIIMTPLLMPTVIQLGIDPVAFGLVFVLNVTIGAITPPFGTIMYTVCALNDVKPARYVREIWPFLLAVLAVLVLITYVPGLVTFLPNLLAGP
jgi:tripartite ATP-independent transporter DctM subunit